MESKLEAMVKQASLINYSDLCKNTNYTKRNVSKILQRLVKGGHLIKIKRGLYANAKKIDEFSIGNYLFNGYIGLSSAMYLHKKKTEHPNTIYIFVKKTGKKRRIGNYEYVPINTKFAVGMEYINDHLVSNLPKTVFDMLSKPKYANYDIICEIISNFNEKDWNTLILYLNQFGGGAEISRAGYLAEICSAPNEFVEKIYKMRKKGVYYLKNKMSGKFVNKWSLYDDR